MENYLGTERRKENIFMQERIAVLEERSKKIDCEVSLLDSEFKNSRESIIILINKIPELLKAIESLTAEFKGYKEKIETDFDNKEEKYNKHENRCADIDSRLINVEKELKNSDEVIKDFMRKNWRVGLLGGLIGGLIGKLTPDLIKLIIDVVSKIFIGL